MTLLRLYLRLTDVEIELTAEDLPAAGADVLTRLARAARVERDAPQTKPSTEIEEPTPENLPKGITPTYWEKLRKAFEKLGAEGNRNQIIREAFKPRTPNGRDVKCFNELVHASLIQSYEDGTYGLPPAADAPVAPADTGGEET